MNVLFVCGRNQWRSPTAEAVFAGHEGIEVDSAGLDRDAVVRVSVQSVLWADLIFVMEKGHRTKLQRQFRKWLGGKRVICLEIPDRYEYMDDDLVHILKQRVNGHLKSS
jgi:predicted protein tyrosine phosphatase